MAEDPTERSVERLVQAFCALELPPEWELLGVRPQRAEEDVLFPERGQSLVQVELVLRHRITTLQAAPRGEGSSRQTPPEARPSAVPSAGPPRSNLDEARALCRDLAHQPLEESPRCDVEDARDSFVSTVSGSTAPAGVSHSHATGALASVTAPLEHVSYGADARRARVLRKRAGLRCACFALVVLVALVIPNFQVFTGLVGSFFLSFIGFILPVLLFEKVKEDDDTPLRSLGHLGIALFGVAMALVGTGTSINALRG